MEAPFTVSCGTIKRSNTEFAPTGPEADPNGPHFGTTGDAPRAFAIEAVKALSKSSAASSEFAAAEARSPGCRKRADEAKVAKAELLRRRRR